MVTWHPSNPDANCVRENAAGMAYEELSCLYPSLGKTYSSFEIDFNPVAGRDWMRDHPEIPIAACILYGLFIVFGRKYFEIRKAWSWRTTLSFWNFGLSVFSGIGFCRTFPQLWHNLNSFSLEENMCQDPESAFGSGSTGLWVQLFILSKFPELFDTFFIVIHKKPLIFLHWYHHVTVLLYCWHSYVSSSPYGLMFTTMNYAVHSIMYLYYFLMAIKRKPKWLNPLVITVAQISQMVVGVAVTLCGFYYYPTKGCMIKMENNAAAFCMYGSYLMLFFQFFLKRYFGKKKKKHATSSNGESKKVN